MCSRNSRNNNEKASQPGLATSLLGRGLLCTDVTGNVDHVNRFAVSALVPTLTHFIRRLQPEQALDHHADVRKQIAQGVTVQRHADRQDRNRPKRKRLGLGGGCPLLAS